MISIWYVVKVDLVRADCACVLTRDSPTSGRSVLTVKQHRLRETGLAWSLRCCFAALTVEHKMPAAMSGRPHVRHALPGAI
eukprot:4639455-Pleurochrysis_carterae.AAC.2